MKYLKASRKEDIKRYGHLIKPVMAILWPDISRNLSGIAKQIVVRNGKTLFERTLRGYQYKSKAEPKVIFKLVCLYYGTLFFPKLMQIDGFRDFF
jgi:hypothetical protein